VRKMRAIAVMEPGLQAKRPRRILVSWSWTKEAHLTQPRGPPSPTLHLKILDACAQLSKNVPEEAPRQIFVAGEIKVGPLHRLSAFAPEVFDDSDASPDPIPSESAPAAPESDPPPPNRRRLRRAWDVGGMRRMRFRPTRKERDYRRRRMHDSTYWTFPAIALDLVETYCVTVLIQLGNKELEIVSGVDTCTSGNMISEDRIPPGFEILPVIQPHFTAANDMPMVVHGMGMLPIRLGEGEDVIPMYLVRGLPLPMLLGTPFTNRYVRYIDCQAQLNLVQMLAGSTSVKMQSQIRIQNPK
jgi:hypothetical protein